MEDRIIRAKNSTDQIDKIILTNGKVVYLRNIKSINARILGNIITGIQVTSDGDPTDKITRTHIISEDAIAKIIPMGSSIMYGTLEEIKS